MKSVIVSIMSAVALISSCMTFAADPLPSWKDGPAKQSIMAFVQKVTKKDSPDFVPVAKRIATFDNDGTLWSEKPKFSELFFAIDQVKKMAPQHPEWKTEQPFAGILKGDLKTAFADGKKSLMKIVYATHAGMSNEDFKQTVKDWIAVAKHPAKHKLYTQMTYQPMLELLAYFRVNQFKIYIVSGGESEFMRAWTEQVYGVPPEQVIGSLMSTKVDVKDGNPVVMREPKVAFIDNHAGKVKAIAQYIGRKPIAAFGNSDGDLQMLEYASKGKSPHFALYVHHTDAVREFAYDKGLKQGLVEAKARGWTIVDMKRDWKKVYSSDQ